MDSTPLGKVLNGDTENNKIGRFIKFNKESPSRRDKILRRYQTMRKREGHQARKDFNQKKREREREKERSECKNFHQVVREY